MSHLDPSAVHRTSWPQVWLLLGAGVIAACHTGKAPIALPVIRAEYGIGLDAAAWILSAFPIVGGLTGAGLGLMVIRLGPRAAVLAGLVLLAAASAAGGLAPGLATLLLSRVGEGLGMLTVSIAAPALMERVCTAEDRPMAFAVWSTFMPVGMALGMTMTPLLAAIGWRGLWLALAAAAVAVALLARRVLPPGAARAPAPGGRPLADLAETARAAGPVLLTLTFFGWAVVWAVLTGFLPTLLIERAGVTLAWAGPLTALVGAATIVGNLAAGPLLRRGVPRWALLAFAGAAVAVCALAIFSPRVDPWVAYGFALVLTLVGGMVPSCVLGGAGVLAPSRHLIAATLGMIMQGSNLGLIVGPAAVGLAVGPFGWDAAGWVMLAPAVLIVAAALRLRRI